MNQVHRTVSCNFLALTLLLLAVQAVGSEDGEPSRDGQNYFGFPASDSLFRNPKGSLFLDPHLDTGGETDGGAPLEKWKSPQSGDWGFSADSELLLRQDQHSDLFRLLASNPGPTQSPDNMTVTYPEEDPDAVPEVAGNSRIFFKGWLLITSVEVVLLGVTATLPKSWTGWSSTFVQDGMGNFRDAYSSPPVWDTDHWFHNYIGHPYGGNVYYNTVRSQGAKKGQSFLFATALSVQWEYLFEAVAEMPSIQDLFITPVFGSLLGEFVHRLTATLKKNGTNLGEKIIITILNPTSVFYNGYN